MRCGVKALKLAFPLLGAAMALAACVRTASPYPPPPPLQVEVMPKPPVTTTPLIWRPGYWEWTGAAYAWVPGAYVPRAGHSDLWVPGYWTRSGSAWIWQPAHWQ